MNDDVKAALRRFAEYCRKFSHGEARVYERNAEDIEAALAHIDGESARLAAAREEQREACAQAAKRVGWSIAASPHANLDAVCSAVRATPLDATPLADELRTLRAALERATEGVRYWTDLAQAEARDAAALRRQVEFATARAAVAEDALSDALVRESMLRALVADMESIDEALRQECAALRARVAELEAEVRATKDLAATVVAIREARVAELEAFIVDACREKTLHGSTPSLITGASKLGIAAFEAWWVERTEEPTRLQVAEAQVAAARAECEKTISLSKSRHAKEELAALWQNYAANAADVLRAMDEAVGTAPAPPVAHARETGGEVVPGGGGTEGGSAAP